jgi:3-methyladenine DNA glycosylase/8-oxoguanine DNA glycosylase
MELLEEIRKIKDVLWIIKCNQNSIDHKTEIVENLDSIFENDENMDIALKLWNEINDLNRENNVAKHKLISILNRNNNIDKIYTIFERISQETK